MSRCFCTYVYLFFTLSHYQIFPIFITSQQLTTGTGWPMIRLMKPQKESTPRTTAKRPGQLPESTPKSDATREMIVAAARKVFVRHPYHKASIRTIAAEGGFHFSLINHYFTKSELFGAVVAQVSQELLDNFISWLEGLSVMSPEDGFSLFLDRALDHFFKHPDVLRILMKNAGEADSEETTRAFDHFTKYVFVGSDILVGELCMEKNINDTVVWFYGVLNLLINFVGAAHYHCQVLSMDHNGPDFRKWVKNCLMYLFTPTLKDFFPTGQSA